MYLARRCQGESLKPNYDPDLRAGAHSCTPADCKRGQTALTVIGLGLLDSVISVQG